IARRLEEHPQAKVLLSIPGVGAITAAAIWAWLGEPNRFRTGKQVASYAGLDPSVHQSGETYYHGRISNNGNRLLRTLLIEAAQTLARYDRGQLGAFFRRKCLQIGAKRAIVALARKLVVLAWRMLQRGQTYREQVPATTQRKQTPLRRLSHRTTPPNPLRSFYKASFRPDTDTLRGVLKVGLPASGERLTLRAAENPLHQLRGKPSDPRLCRPPDRFAHRVGLPHYRF
ncbi:MAG TPA: IS110 family transposase, partial [Firmicutes bacterium]|nr:IS110 family transposase [Candidatus Fermentithermobacillaceae bacterium]